MREAGITRFLTQKLSWNRFTQPEHHTFTWQGLDGSEVLTHFPPADTYNAEATVAELWRESAAYKDHGRSHHSLLVFGHGDGGGGPTAEMLERLARARDIHGLPRTTVRSPGRVLRRPRGRRERPADRRRRALLRAAPRHLHVAGGRQARQPPRRGRAARRRAAGRAGRRASYPREELARLWETLLLNQFHDILPGSSINEVNVRARADLAEVEAGADAICDAVLGRGDVPFNTRAFARREVVEHDGEPALVDVPPCGAGVIVAAGYDARAGDFTPVRVTRRDDGAVELANEHLTAVIAPDGTVTSLVAGGREALSAPANRFELYEDLPTAWDAWDVDPAHLETREDVAPAGGITWINEHPLRAEVVFERGWIAQNIRLDAGSRRLEFHTDVDWRFDHRFLKVAFPLAVHATEATYEVAFGAVRRPTHYSSRADLAMYEVPGHRWADLSEHGFGVAVLTDSKYGYSAFGDTLRISLLRAPRSPDPEADRGLHTFSYALLPHSGDLAGRRRGRGGDGVQLADPLRRARPRVAGRAWTAASSLDTVKRAEDSDALVLRLYEPHGGRGVCRIRVPGTTRASFQPAGAARRAAHDRGRRGRVAVQTVGDHHLDSRLGLTYPPGV